MAKQLKKFIVLIILMGIFNVSFSQPEYYYYKLKLKSSDIKPLYNNPNFYKFVFNFKETSTPGYYILKGAAFDINNNQIGSSFDVDKTIPRAPRKLPNLFAGTITLLKDTMMFYNMDVSKDYYLHPKKFHEGKADQKDYVSYLVHDHSLIPLKTEPIVLTFSPFSIDPSPPAH